MCYVMCVSEYSIICRYASLKAVEAISEMKYENGMFEFCFFSFPSFILSLFFMPAKSAK